MQQLFWRLFCVDCRALTLALTRCWLWVQALPCLMLPSCWNHLPGFPILLQVSLFEKASLHSNLQHLFLMKSKPELIVGANGMQAAQMLPNGIGMSPIVSQCGTWPQGGMVQQAPGFPGICIKASLYCNLEHFLIDCRCPDAVNWHVPCCESAWHLASRRNVAATSKSHLRYRFGKSSLYCYLGTLLNLLKVPWCRCQSSAVLQPFLESGIKLFSRGQVYDKILLQ